MTGHNYKLEILDGDGPQPGDGGEWFVCYCDGPSLVGFFDEEGYRDIHKTSANHGRCGRIGTPVVEFRRGKIGKNFK
jgi:hypothetical protein